jgi:DNA-nicking Smr family endonuclease
LFSCQSLSLQKSIEAAMTKRREPTDGELALWTEVMRDVRRNNKRRRVSKLKPSEPVRKAKDPVPQATVTRATAGEKKPAQTVEKKPPPQVGLDGSTMRRLREGKVVPDAKLDLHGMTQAQAHQRLATFLHRAFDHGLRCVLVVTGKGGGRPDREDRLPSEKHSSQSHGVLRGMVPRWLSEGDIRRYVSGTAEAHVRHGGAGAIYVYLRRR